MNDIAKALGAATASAAIAYYDKNALAVLAFIIVALFIYDKLDDIKKTKQSQDRSSIKRANIDLDLIRHFYYNLGCMEYEIKELKETIKLQEWFQKQENQFQTKKTREIHEKFSKSLDELIETINANSDSALHKGTKKITPSVPKHDKSYFDESSKLQRQLKQITSNNQSHFDCLIKSWKENNLLD